MRDKGWKWRSEDSSPPPIVTITTSCRHCTSFSNFLLSRFCTPCGTQKFAKLALPFSYFNLPLNLKLQVSCGRSTSRKMAQTALSRHRSTLPPLPLRIFIISFALPRDGIMLGITRQCLCFHVFCYNKNVTLLTILYPPPPSDII